MKKMEALTEGPPDFDNSLEGEPNQSPPCPGLCDLCSHYCTPLRGPRPCPQLR